VTEQTTISFVVRAPIARPDLPGLCERLRDRIAQHNARRGVCEVDGLAADAIAVDALARLRLAACRCGCAVSVEGWSADLEDLIAFLGLRDALLSD
jgi:translation initiation factor 1 (eIF-1/SUI1)